MVSFNISLEHPPNSSPIRVVGVHNYGIYAPGALLGFLVDCYDLQDSHVIS